MDGPAHFKLPDRGGMSSDFFEREPEIGVGVGCVSHVSDRVLSSKAHFPYRANLPWN